MVRVAAWLREKALIDCNRCSFLMSSSIQVQESCAVIELELGVAFRVDSRLRHIGLGVLDGLTQKEAQDQYPKMWDALRLWSQGTANIGHVRIPGQEDVSDFYARIYAFWEDVLLRTEHDTVVVGTRSVGIAIANIAELGSRVFESDKYLRYALDPASISRFQVSPGASSVVYTNDTSFLAHRPALPDLR